MYAREVVKTDDAFSVVAESGSALTGQSNHFRHFRGLNEFLQSIGNSNSKFE